MKNCIVALFSFCLFGCNNGNDGPDVSDVDVKLTMQRFDRDFFSIDTLNIDASVNALAPKYPTVLPLFLQNILGLDSSNFYEGVKTFIRLTAPIQDTINVVFRDTDNLEKELTNAYKHVRYYFPQYPVPKIVTVTGPVDLLAQMSNGDYTPNFLGPDFMGISLQFYLGKDFGLYNAEFFITNVAPQYRSRRFSKEYITADVMKLVVDDLFPEKSGSRGLIEQMIEKGKQWWLLDKFLPSQHDSLKTGFTGNQLIFCERNEGLIWQKLITDEKNLYTNDPVSVQTYLGEAPFTQTMGDNSPGNIGQWIGWQIVKKYVENNPSLKPEEVMRSDARKIFDEAIYKPK